MANNFLKINRQCSRVVNYACPTYDTPCLLESFGYLVRSRNRYGPNPAPTPIPYGPEFVKLYYFMFPYIENNNFFIQTKLPPSDPDYLLLNEFNYAETVSPLIISPNYSVLYFPAVLDLTYLRGTNDFMKLTLPNDIKTTSRYYILQFIDLFTNNFFYISSQTNTSATAITEWKIVAPDYVGEILPNMVKANSWYMLILGRIEVDFRTPGDLQKAIIFEKEFILDAGVVLDPNDIKLPDTTNLLIKEPSLNITDYYNAALQIVQWQTYFTEQDQLSLQSFKKLGITINKTPFITNLQPFTPTTDLSFYKKGSLEGQSTIEYILTNVQATSETKYWGTSANIIGNQGPLRYRDYTYIAWQYIYGNNKDQAIYLSCYVDEDNHKLNGQNVYTLALPSLPPVSTKTPSFWSITAYTISGYIEQHENQEYYTVGENITTEPCTITFSSESPTDPEDPLYLQVPNDDFYLLLRMYNPAFPEADTYFPDFMRKSV